MLNFDRGTVGPEWLSIKHKANRTIKINKNQFTLTWKLNRSSDVWMMYGYQVKVESIINISLKYRYWTTNRLGLYCYVHIRIESYIYYSKCVLEKTILMFQGWLGVRFSDISDGALGVVGGTIYKWISDNDFSFNEMLTNENIVIPHWEMVNQLAHIT